MQQHRIISLLSIVIMLIIPVIGWFLVAQPQFAAAAAADMQRSDLQAQIENSRAVVAQLKADTAQLPELNDDLNKLRTSIPAGVDSSGYIDGLDALAQISGVSITGLTVSDPVAYVPATPPAAPAPTTTTDDAADDAEGEPAPAVTPPPVADPAIVTSPLIDSTNFVTIPVTVDVTGPFNSVLSFVDGLQSSPRLFLVAKLSTTESESEGTVTGTIGGFIYAIPTGVEGKPRPISTTVKSLTPPEPVVEENTDEEGTDGETDGATPDPTNTPSP